MALRDGVRAALPMTACMVRDYQQRSPFTSYANMARQCSGRKGSMVGCRAEKLVRAVEYIQDPLDTDLTVSGIAQAVRMSPRSLHQGVQRVYRPVALPVRRRCRVKKARELLTTGNFTSAKLTRQVGFADQSHLPVISKEFSAYLLRGCLSRRRPKIVV